ncbi:alpha/beta hydrolase [Candidatus Nomurabacteria bacterium]|nr:alpha/beta hydrolase [Candidatus Nomurabacteria bacterium]
MKENITLEDSSGNKILTTISVPEQARHIVIISHGFSSSKDSKLYIEFEKELNNINIGTIRYDGYGHGKLYCSDTPYQVSADVTLDKSVESLNTIIKYVKELGSYKISLLGSSYGGLVSLLSASQNKDIQSLILKSPVTEPVAFWENRLGQTSLKKWKETGILKYDDLGERFELKFDFFQSLSKFNTLELSKHISCPIFIVHGNKDNVVPIDFTYKFTNNINATLYIIEGADHSYSNLDDYKEMKEKIINFIKATDIQKEE